MFSVLSLFTKRIPHGFHWVYVFTKFWIMLINWENFQEFSWILTYSTAPAKILVWKLSCCACFQSKYSERNYVCEETLSSGFQISGVRGHLSESAFAYFKNPVSKSTIRFSQIFWFWLYFPCCFFLPSIIATKSSCKKNKTKTNQWTNTKAILSH